MNMPDTTLLARICALAGAEVPRDAAGLLDLRDRLRDRGHPFLHTALSCVMVARNMRPSRNAIAPRLIALCEARAHVLTPSPRGGMPANGRTTSLRVRMAPDGPASVASVGAWAGPFNDTVSSADVIEAALLLAETTGRLLTPDGRVLTFHPARLVTRDAAEPWSDDDVAELVAARERGEPYAAIAERLGRSAGACAQRYHRHTVESTP